MAVDYLKQSYYFFRSNLSSLLSIQLPFIAGLMLIQRSLVGDLEDGSNLQDQLFMLTAMDLLFVPIYLGASIFYMQSIVDKQPISALQAWALGLKNWGRLFFTFLLSAIAISLGLMLLVIPGLYIAVRLGIANQICLLEGRGPMDALKMSWAGTADLFWTLAKGLAIIYGFLFVAELMVAPIAEGSLLFGMLLSVLLDFLNVFGAIYSFRIYRAWRDREPLEE
ncbi:MAG TPA: YciC family protein [Marinobacterium sp.]|nr:YciC family protein [Marinobacterium sp.]